MDIDKRLNEMEPKDTPLLVLGYILLGMLLFLPATANASDNEVLLDQTGDNLELNILQEGSGNEITIKQIGGDDFDLSIIQVGTNNIIKGYDYSSYIEGDDMDLMLVQYNDTTTNNVIEYWHLDGDDNTVRWGQGVAWTNSTSDTFSNDGDEGSGHYARLDIHGDNNHMQGHQTNQGSTSGHTFTSIIYSDNNDIWARQQHDGGKTINLTTWVDGNDITLRQKGAWAQHSATISLSGSEPTTLNLLQQGTTSQSYSLSQTCYTVGGCSISVTQGN